MNRLHSIDYLQLRKLQLEKIIEVINKQDSIKMKMIRDLDMISVLSFLGYETISIIMMEDVSLAQKMIKPANTLTNFLKLNDPHDDLALLTFVHANKDFVEDCLELLKES